MVSQVLFGEIIEILDRQQANWWKVRCLWDNYIGWVSSLQFSPIAADAVEACSLNHSRSLEIVQPAVHQDYFLPLTMGAQLPMYDGLTFQFPDRTYQFSGQTIIPADVRSSSELIVKIARRYLHAPYLWGGRSPLGIDCSGFVQIVFLMAGIALPRDANKQVAVGEPVDFAANMRAGDLAYFVDQQGRTTHVGIVLEPQKIIHASGQVKIDRLDHYGIFSEQEQRYTHTLRVIKRLIDEEA